MSSIQLPAKIENMEQLIQFISDAARAHGFSGKRIKEIELASEEVLVTIINYAYPDCQGNIKISCMQDLLKSLIIEIEDTGIVFDMLSIKEPDISADISDRQIGGLGVFLVRKLIDEVIPHRKDSKNILKLVVYASNRTNRNKEKQD